ncbi:hypothetical protein NL676_000602 [Syzygium grande]|nr:hypothetical protein NL676_000602 [Syzygium grande]
MDGSPRRAITESLENKKQSRGIEVGLGWTRGKTQRTTGRRQTVARLGWHNTGRLGHGAGNSASVYDRSRHMWSA